MLEHGGRLREASMTYGIPLADWLDLSTGLNPRGWPVPPLPAEDWQRLPEENDGLEEARATITAAPACCPSRAPRPPSRPCPRSARPAGWASSPQATPNMRWPGTGQAMG